MFCYNLSEVCHFLEQLGKELGGLGVVHLELELQGLQQVVLDVLNGLHVQQTWAVWGRRRTGGSVTDSSGPYIGGIFSPTKLPDFLLACFVLVLE